MRNSSTRKLTLSGLFLAFGLVLPFFTAQIPSIGSRLLPMHIPVLLCGFVCGWQYGFVVGLIVPIFRSLTFGMPPMFPTAIAMSFELATYGCLAGLLFRRFPARDVFIYLTLVLSMLCGRIVWGVVSLFLYGMSGATFGWKVFLGGAFFNATPGIVLQLILLPFLVIVLQKAGLIEHVKS